MASLKPIVLEVQGKAALDTMRDVERQVNAYSRQLKAAKTGTAEFEQATVNLAKAKVVLADMKAEASALAESIYQDSAAMGKLSGSLSQMGAAGSKSGNSLGLISKNLDLLGPAGQKVGMAQQLLGRFTGSAEGAGTAVAGMGVKVMAAMGIIGLIIAVVGAFIQWFMKLDGVAKWVSGALNTVSIAVDNLMNRLNNIGSELSSLFSDPIKYFSDLGDDMEKAYDAGMALSEAEDALDEAQRKASRSGAILEAQISQLELQAKNRSLAEQDRIALIKHASELERQDFQNRKAIIEQEVAIEESKLAQKVKNANRTVDLASMTNAKILALAEAGKLEMGSVTDEELNHYVEVQNKKTALIKASNDLQEKLANKEAALEQQIEAERKQRLDERQKREEKARKQLEEQLKATADMYKKLAQDRASSIVDEVERETALAKLRAENERESIRNSKANAKARAEALIQVDFQLGEDLRKIDAEAAKKRADDQEKAIADELKRMQAAALAKADLEVLLAQRKVRNTSRSGDDKELQRAQQEELDALVARETVKRDITLQQQGLTEEQRQLIVAQAEDAMTALVQKGEDDRNDQRYKGLLQGLDQAARFTQLLQQVYTAADQAQLAKIDSNKARRLATLDDELKRNIINQDQYNKKKAQIEQQAEDDSKTLKREQFEEQKAFQLVLATIAAARAVVEAMASAGGNFFDPRVIAATAAGLVQVGIIATQEAPQFKDGGIINPMGGIMSGGSLHSEGGIKMLDGRTGKYLGEWEKDEAYMILSRNMVRNYGPEIRTMIDISRSGGHRRQGSIFEQGGVVPADRRGPSLPSAGLVSSDRQVEMLQKISDQLAGIQISVDAWPKNLKAVVSTQQTYDELTSYQKLIDQAS